MILFVLHVKARGSLNIECSMCALLFCDISSGPKEVKDSKYIILKYIILLLHTMINGQTAWASVTCDLESIVHNGNNLFFTQQDKSEQQS